MPSDPMRCGERNSAASSTRSERKKAAAQNGSGLDHEPGDPAPGQQLEGGRKVGPAVIDRAREEPRPLAHRAPARARAAVSAVDDPKSRLARACHQLARERQPQLAVEHDPHRRTAFMPGHRQVSSGSSASTVPMPVSTASLVARMQMNTRPHRFAGDRRRPAAGEAGLAIGRDRELEDHMRASVLHATDVAGMRPLRFVGADADLDHDALLRHPPMTRTRHLRIRIDHRRDHPLDPGGDDGVGAGRGLAMMRAGLERDIEGRAACRCPACASALVSACGRPPGWVQPRPTTMPSSHTTTAPTAGLGQVRPSPRRPSANASAMKRASSRLRSVRPRSCVHSPGAMRARCYAIQIHQQDTSTEPHADHRKGKARADA